MKTNVSVEKGFGLEFLRPRLIDEEELEQGKKLRRKVSSFGFPFKKVYSYNET